jgi:hypothetical protein
MKWKHDEKITGNGKNKGDEKVIIKQSGNQIKKINP